VFDLKVTIIGGSGRVGRAAAFCLAEEDMVDYLVLYSRESSFGKIKGESMDMYDALAAKNVHVSIIPSTDMAEIRDSKLVIIAAGRPRDASMSRQDLADANGKIVAQYAESIAKYAPNSIIVVITNPVDVMTYVALKASGFDKRKVMGLGNHLDSLRLKNMMSKHFDIHVSEIHTRVIGEHGDHMVPLMSSTSIGGIPIKYYPGYEDFDIYVILEKVKMAGQYVISKKGSTEYGPAFAISNLVSTILNDEKKILTVTTYVNGEIDEVEDVCLGVPVKLGINGVEEIIPLSMSEYENNKFLESSKVVKKATKEVLSGLEKSGLL
jgi:malate dehydrogenase